MNMSLNFKKDWKCACKGQRFLVFPMKWSRAQSVIGTKMVSSSTRCEGHGSEQ